MTDTLERALDLMRRAQFRSSVAEIAYACGLSPFQFARLFAGALGMAPGAYMARARLEAAAAALVDNADVPLAEIALDAGFESQQTFTRAFTRSFGLSPGRYRKERKMRPTKNAPELAYPPILLRSQKRLQRIGPLRTAGFCVEVDGTGGRSPADAWARLDPLLPIEGQEPGYTVGVCWSEPGADTFTYMAGVVLHHGARAPAGLELRQVPRQTYAVVRQHIKPGPFVPQLRAGIRAVWSDRLPRMKITPSGGPDFEVYPDELVAGETAGWLEYRIPVEDAAA
jgi:AraC family transcriptional regulator